MATKGKDQTKSLAEYGGDVGKLLWQKLMGQLTPEQRDILMTSNQLRDLSDALHPNEPDMLYRRAETNLTHDRILLEVQHGEALLTGANEGKILEEDRSWADRSVARACVRSNADALAYQAKERGRLLKVTPKQTN